MFDRVYTAIVERNRQGKFFGHVPDLPGVTASGDSVDEMMGHLAEFADDYVSDLAESGHPVPEPTPFEQVERDPEVEEFMRIGVPVLTPGTSVKVSVSMDKALLKRIDHTATLLGTSRSAFLSEAATARIAQYRRGGQAAAEGGKAVEPKANIVEEVIRYGLERYAREQQGGGKKI